MSVGLSPCVRNGCHRTEARIEAAWRRTARVDAWPNTHPPNRVGRRRRVGEGRTVSCPQAGNGGLTLQADLLKVCFRPWRSRLSNSCVWHQRPEDPWQGRSSRSRSRRPPFPPLPVCWPGSDKTHRSKRGKLCWCPQSRVEPPRGNRQRGHQHQTTDSPTHNRGQHVTSPTRRLRNRA